MLSNADYRVMRWSGSVDGPWTAEATARFREGGFDGLMIVPSGDWAPADLEFLRDLSGLRRFSYSGRLQNDVTALMLAGLESLALATGSRRRVPDVAQPDMRSVTLTDRPGINAGTKWPALESLRIGTWRGSDFAMVAGSPNLARIYIEGKRQQGTLVGLDACPLLEELTLINYSARGTAPLRALDRLRDVRLLAAKPTHPHGPIDFRDFSSARLERIWISNAPQIQNIPALSELPALRQLRLIDCPIDVAARQVLDDLPRRVSVEILE
jgi:hypothetical protein